MLVHVHFIEKKNGNTLPDTVPEGKKENLIGTNKDKRAKIRQKTAHGVCHCTS